MVLYEEGELIGDADGGDIDSENIYKESTELVLVPPSNLYLLLESISVGTSGPFAYSTSYYL